LNLPVSIWRTCSSSRTPPSQRITAGVLVWRMNGTTSSSRQPAQDQPLRLDHRQGHQLGSFRIGMIEA
jgi:hypothetical protein